MPIWYPSPIHQGDDIVIVGGGSSLEHFDFQRLSGKVVIGCNDAFTIGPNIITYCLFGDNSFWNKKQHELETFAQEGGQVVSCATAVLNYHLPWVRQMSRQQTGIHTGGHTVGWNFSTGAAAVNLALMLGAKRAFLLGFDMGRREDGRTHWHNRMTHVPDETYDRFIRGFQQVEKDLQKHDMKVFNVTDGTSKLPVFDRVTFEEFWRMLENKAEPEKVTPPPVPKSVKGRAVARPKTMRVISAD